MAWILGSIAPIGWGEEHWRFIIAGILIIPALTNDSEGNQISNWPDRWPLNRLLAKKQEIGPIPFSSQFMLDPVNLEHAFLKREWLQFYLDEDLPDLINYIGVDPSPSGRQGTDYFALAVLGVDVAHVGYLESAYRIQIDPLEQAQRIRIEAGVWHPALVMVEAVAAQALFTRYMLQDVTFPLREGTTRFPKELRYVSMSRLFASGRIKIRGKRNSDGEIVPADSVADFVEEWVGYAPKGPRDDTLDAVEKAIEASQLISGNPVFQASRPENVPVGRGTHPGLASGGNLLRGTRTPFGNRQLRSRRSLGRR